MEIKLESITPHVSADITTQQKTRSSLIGAISLEEYSIAVDSGNPAIMGVTFRKALEKHFDIPVKYLFLTHSHMDHRGGMEAFQENCSLLISEKTKENMPTNARLNKYNIKTFDEKFVLEENDTRVEFIKVAGHSIGSSIAYIPSEKIVFGGDLFFYVDKFNIPFFGFYQNKPRRTGNPEEYLKAFDILLDMDIDILLPGHGKLIENPKEHFKSEKIFFLELKEYFTSVIDEGLTIEGIQLPELDRISHAYEVAEQEKQRSKAKKFVDSLLRHLKICFYNYYSGEWHQD
jgi:glyoxylase-like metal-dependent hydrolase (beta-lactamase superfamily II)